jgi:hypothetical protein
VIFFLTIFVISMFSGPLNLNWGEKHTVIQKVENYRYWFGDIGWGDVIYVGKEGLGDLETELQLKYVGGRLSSATLILGPSGLNDLNCVRKTKQIIGLLNKKYGHYRYQRLFEKPSIDELVYSSPCRAVRVGLYEFRTRWVLDKFRIESSLIGDDGGFYIEIEYTYLALRKAQKKRDRKKLLKGL